MQAAGTSIAVSRDGPTAHPRDIRKPESQPPAIDPTLAPV
jgi:hypothetical protein